MIVKLRYNNRYQLLDRLRWLGFITSQQYKSQRKSGCGAYYIYSIVKPNDTKRVPLLLEQKGRLQQLGLWDDIVNSDYMIPVYWIEWVKEHHVI
jgi:hypothetical protein